MTDVIIKRLFAVMLLGSLCLPSAVKSAQPVVRTLKTADDFLAGKMENIALLHDGQLCLSPRMNLVFDTGDPYVWAMACDGRGNLFLATGNDGRIYKVTARGDTSLFFDAPESEVYALAVDKQDRLYAATSPNGKIYLIRPDGSNEIFFMPNETYIWDIKMEASGGLLVATGSKAKLFRVLPDGSSTLLYHGETEHIRCLALDRHRQVYWGTSSPGLVYRLGQDNTPFVVYDPAAEEVHDLSIADDGKIFAAVFTERERARPGPQVPQEEKSRETPEIETETVLSSLSMLVEETLGAKTKTQLLMITPEGYGINLWNRPDDVQTLAVIDNDVLVGTGKKGRIFRVTRSGEASVVIEVEPSHISAFLKTADEALYIATSNMGRCYRLQESSNDRGAYESQPLDAGSLASWGVLQWQGHGTVTFATRSGNSKKPEGTWSKWEETVADQGVQRIKSPAARFLQWRCELKDKEGSAPKVRQLSISYLQKNLPPEVNDITVHPHGVYLGGGRTSSDQKGIIEPQPVPKGEDKRGYRSVDWQFSDPNGDALLFDVYYRLTTEPYWRALTKEFAGNYFSWDTFQLQDGEYQIKIIATDGCNLPTGEALTTEKLGQTFIVDNTGPVIKQVRQQMQSAEVVVTFTVCDEVTPLLNVVYSIDAQGWLNIHPMDGICDSPCETFLVKLPKHVQPETITIKATDRLNNFSVKHTQLKNSK